MSFQGFSEVSGKVQTLLSEYDQLLEHTLRYTDVVNRGETVDLWALQDLITELREILDKFGMNCVADRLASLFFHVAIWTAHDGMDYTAGINVMNQFISCFLYRQYIGEASRALFVSVALYEARNNPVVPKDPYAVLISWFQWEGDMCARTCEVWEELTEEELPNIAKEMEAYVYEQAAVPDAEEMDEYSEPEEPDTEPDDPEKTPPSCACPIEQAAMPFSQTISEILSSQLKARYRVSDYDLTLNEGSTQESQLQTYYDVVANIPQLIEHTTNFRACIEKIGINDTQLGAFSCDELRSRQMEHAYPERPELNPIEHHRLTYPMDIDAMTTWRDDGGDDGCVNVQTFQSRISPSMHQWLDKWFYTEDNDNDFEDAAVGDN